jgi:hypothetical protein
MKAPNLCLFLLLIRVVLGWRWVQHWWNDTEGENWSNGRENCAMAIASAGDVTWTGPGWTPDQWLTVWAKAQLFAGSVSIMCKDSFCTSQQVQLSSV